MDYKKLYDSLKFIKKLARAIKTMRAAPNAPWGVKAVYAT